MHRAHRLVRLATVAGILVLGLIDVAPVAACTGPPFTFREHATEAALVVIGDVTAVDASATLTDDASRSSVFTVQVSSVVRGVGEETLVVADRWSDPCGGLVMARTGDRLALALGVASSSWEQGLTAVAWIRGTPPDLVGMERITEREVLQLLGPKAPDTSTGSHRGPSAPVLIAGLITLLVVAVIGTTGRRHDSLMRHPNR